MGFGEAEALRIALGGQTVDVRPSGIGETHYLGALVERFAGGVVDGLAKNFHIVVVLYQNQLGIATGDKQAEKRVFRHAVVWFAAHEMAEHMAMEVVYVDDGDAQTQRKPFGKGGAHKQRTQQSRATGERYGRKIGLAYARAAYCRVDYRHDVLLVGARCQFRYHAAVFLVNALGCDYVGEQQPVADYCRGSVVAARFNS